MCIRDSADAPDKPAEGKKPAEPPKACLLYTSQEIYEEGLRQVVRRQYARGGCTLQRGYYCPSPVLDIIAGNKDRGRLLKKLSGKQPDYMYGFNEAGELLIIDGPWSALTNGPYYREVLLRDSEREIGLRFQEVFGLSLIHI